MSRESWLTQADKPLFPEVLWSQPVNKKAAGKLLIIGGHAMQFSLTQNSYVAALDLGVGSVKVVLPDNIQRLAGNLPDCEFLPSTPSGSLARNGLETLLSFTSQVDAVLLPGELSSNTETIGLIESLIDGSASPLLAADEVIEMMLHTPPSLKPVSLFVASALNFSKLAKALHIPVYVKTRNLRKEIDLLKALKEELDTAFVLYDGENTVVHADGQTSVTKYSAATTSALTAACATFFIQHNDKFKALTTAIYQLSSTRNTT